jgi:hypothetical protein
MSNWSYTCEDICVEGEVWNAMSDACECAGYGEVFDWYDDTCDCPSGEFWDTDMDLCECPTGEYWDYWYDICEWDIWGYYTDATCVEEDHYEDDAGECIEWTCEALGDRIDELLGEIEAIAPEWNDALGPILAAEEELLAW